jgi:hypothetical protein
MRWLTIALQVAQNTVSPGTVDAPKAAQALTFTTIQRCRDEGVGDVLVCGHRRDRYRLPLPTERAASTERAPGEATTGMAALTPVGRCGMFAGERRCSKREAEDYGYGKGRDPITVLSRLASKAIDSDAD